MKNIKTSLTLKTLCYIFIPIFLVTFFVNLIVGIVLAKDPNIFNSKNVYATEEFANIYYAELNSLYNQINNVIITIKENEDNLNEDDDIYYYTVHYNEYVNENNEKIIYNISSYYVDFDFVVLDTESNTVYTNLPVTSNKNNIESLIQYVKNEDVAYWNFVNGNVESNIDNLKKENIAYSDNLYEWMSSNNKYEVYTTLNNSDGISGNFWELEVLYSIMQPIAEAPYQLNALISVILLIIAITYLIRGLGHKKGHEGIYLNWLDKIPLEFIILLFCFGLFFNFWILNSINYASLAYSIIGIITSSFVLYLAIAISLTTIIKRIKAHVLIKNTITYKIISWIINCIKDFLTNTKLIIKLTILYGGFVFLYFILMLLSATYFDFGFPMFLLFVMLAIVFIMLYNYTKNLYKVKTAIKKIYEGNNDITLSPNEMKGELKEVAMYINDIAGCSVTIDVKQKRYRKKVIQVV